MRESGGGRVVAGDPAVFGQALRELLADPDRAEIGARGRRFVAERFGWPGVARADGDGVSSTCASALPEADRPMNPLAPVSVMIFTLNEEIHLPSCLEALAWCDDVIVIDSFSTDRTEAICRRARRALPSARLRGLRRRSATGRWIRGAAPRLGPRPRRGRTRAAGTGAELAARRRSAPATVGAYRVRRRFYMWGRWLRYSSLYPTWVVRFVHKDRVRYVDRGHAETQEVNGDIRDLKHDLIDENLKGIDEWFERQNRYSRRTRNTSCARAALPVDWAGLVSAMRCAGGASLKQLAARLPFRPALYFLYSYVFRRGFSTAGTDWCSAG